jgi:hypothetical protein
LVAIFIWDRVDANRDHQETLAQLKVAQDQIKLSQNAERAWVMTELIWPQNELKVVMGSSREGNEPQVHSTTVMLKLICKNEGRSPAWVDKIVGYAERVETRLMDLASPTGHQAEGFHSFGPIGPGSEKSRLLRLEAPGQLQKDQPISIFVAVEYRDIFEQKRVTTCGYTVSGTYLDRQEQFPERNINK